ncbi:hypothetical protein [Dactylosporangium sp. CA-139066]|uniref:hypothetical protein n=1 Tax=Dactylosporangium sp. CA-139066 TaxID=3239930 RepID=UPI003D8F2398
MVRLRLEAGESRWRYAVRLLVVLLCAAALLQAARPGVYSARTGAALIADGDPAGRQFREQQEYIADELDRQVPAGARVVVDSADGNWKLRITELATVRGIVVVGDGGDLVVRVEFDPAAPHGVRVVTRRAGGA